jgi:small subunit ribosomal protein S20
MIGGVLMPNIKSAKKRVLVSKANYEKNKAYRSALRTAIKKANAAIEAKSDDMAVAVTEAVKKIDQAADKGIIHKNNAARKKSALVTRYNKVKA